MWPQDRLVNRREDLRDGETPGRDRVDVRDRSPDRSRSPPHSPRGASPRRFPPRRSASPPLRRAERKLNEEIRALDDGSFEDWKKHEVPRSSIAHKHLRRSSDFDERETPGRWETPGRGKHDDRDRDIDDDLDEGARGARSREDSPISALDGDSLHSDPIDRESGWRQRMREDVDKVCGSSRIDTSGGSRRDRPRRLSMAEGRAYRKAKEKAKDEARAIENARKENERRRLYDRNRRKARQLDRRLSNSSEEIQMSDLRVGDVVMVRRDVNRIGVVRYVGRPHFSVDDEYWLGVELKDPQGDHNGKWKGRHYFNCKENHGIFVQEIQRRLSPEDLLEKLAQVKNDNKKLKAKDNNITKLKFENDMLRNQIAVQIHQIAALKTDQSSHIADAVEDKMENFLEVLADSLNPEERMYRSTPGGPGGGGGSSGPAHLELPARDATDREILGWVHHKKRKHGLNHRNHPKLTEERVQKALVWLIKTFQDEQSGRMDLDYTSD